MESSAEYRCLTPGERSILDAVGEVLLPAGGPVPQSAADAGVIEYLDDYLFKIPARQRRLIRLLLRAVDLGPLLLRPGFKCFTGLSAAERERYLASWEQSGVYARRAAFTSLRALFTMAYLADESVQRQLGMTAAPACSEVVPSARGVDPYAGVKEFGGYKGDMKDEADVVVVGSGPGGAVMARELSRLGRSVILVEEGPIARRGEFVTEPGESMHRWCREDGLGTTTGNVFLPTLHARCLGGTSVINSAICSRAQPSIFWGWHERHGLRAITREGLDPFYDRLKEWLNVRPTEERVLGRRNLLFREACIAMGFSHAPMDRAESGCAGCAECFTGCPTLAKQSADISCIPVAVRDGARVYTSVRAESLLVDGRRVTGVFGRVVTRDGRTGPTLSARGKVVVLAAGPTATPVILLKNGLANKSVQVGRNLQFHPGAAIMGIFPDPVDPWRGATQGYQSLQFLDEGIKLEVLWSPLAILALRFPGFGLPHKEHLSRARFSAPWDAFVLTRRSFGAVKTGGRDDWRPRMSWNFDAGDAALLQRGLGHIADMFFAAGAAEILPGIHGIPSVIKSRERAQAIKTARLAPEDFIVAATHVFGTTRMGGDPARSVVDESCRCHELDNLYITDAGVLPEGTGVNPMFTVMALSLRTAGIIHARL